MDFAKLKQELMQLNSIVSNSATKIELQQVNLEIKRNASIISDTRDDIKLLQQKVTKLESLVSNLDADCKNEFFRQKETNESVDN